jgi:SSS family solute:Na+ symporter
LALVPGIVAYALDPAGIDMADDAYPWLLGQYPSPGLRGLAFAALVATIVSSLASMMNSTATIFTMDLYETSRFGENASEGRLVTTGRIVSFACIAIACLMAPQLAALDQVFQYIQEYTGFVSPGVLAVFMTGLFWSKATPGAALVSAVLSIPLSAGMKWLAPGVPFMRRMLIVFFLSVALIVGVSLLEGKGQDHPKAVDLSDVNLVGDPVYNVAAFGILGITAALYAAFW